MRFAASTVSLTASFAIVAPSLAIDEAHQKKAEVVIAKAMTYLLAQQDKASGGFAVPPKESQQPQYPAITGLILNGMLMQPKLTAEQQAAADRGVAYMLSLRQPDGGIYDGMLPSYNTSICLSALARVNTPEAKEAIKAGQEFLKKSQWGASETAASKAEPLFPVPENHPFYGGVGYGKHGRPDMSNTQFMLQALQDTGVPKDDPAVKRAIKFMARCQMNGKTNDQPYAAGSQQGGFIYATGENGQAAGLGQSFAGAFEETLDNGEKASRLRAYGSMTYAGFKSYLYAGLSPTDPRVTTAMEWISKNYSVDENPGVGQDGRYYFYVTFSRALDATGKATLKTIDSSGKETDRDWQNDLIDAMEKLQNADGSFKSVNERWMENNPILITAYSLVALQHAAR